MNWRLLILLLFSSSSSFFLFLSSSSLSTFLAPSPRPTNFWNRSTSTKKKPGWTLSGLRLGLQKQVSWHIVGSAQQSPWLHHGIFVRDRSFNSFFFLVSNYLLYIFCRLFLLQQRFCAALLVGCDKSELTRWWVCIFFSWHPGVSRWSDMQLFKLKRHCLCTHVFPPANTSVFAPRCSRAREYSLQPTSDC